MHLIKHGRRRLAVGLEWSLQETRSDAKRAAKAYTAALMAPFDEKGVVLAGTDDAQGKTKGLVSAGAFLGLLHQSAIVAYELPDTNQAWFCAIKDGVPVPGADSIVERSELRNKVSEATSWNSGSIIGSVNGSSKTLEQALDEVEAAILSKAISKKAVQLTHLDRGGVSSQHVIAALLITLVIAVMGVGFSFYQKHLADKRNLEQAMRLMMQKEKDRAAEEARIQAAIARFHAQVEAARAKFSTGAIATAQWVACDAVRTSLPLSLFGYVPEKLTCDYKKGIATLGWNQSDRHVRIAGRELLPGVVNAFQTETAPISEFALPSNFEPTSSTSERVPERVKLELLDAVKPRIASFMVESISKVTISPSAEIADKPGIGPVEIGNEVKWKAQTTGFLERLSAPAMVRSIAQYPSSFAVIEWTQLSRPELTVQVSGSVYLSSQP